MVKLIIKILLLVPLLAYGQSYFDEVNVDNIKLDGSTISTTNTNGDLTFDLNGAGKIIFTDQTASTVLYLDGSKQLSGESQLLGTRGGTGVSNAGTLTWGASNLAFTLGGNTSLTLPTSGTVAVLTDLDSKLNLDGTNTMTGAVSLTEISTPSTPSSGVLKLYPKTDSKLYYLNDLGVETEVGSGSAASGGETNYVLNPGAETDDSDVTDSSGIHSRSTSSPIVGVGSHLIDATTAAEQVDFLTDDLPTKLLGQSCLGEFWYLGDASLYEAKVLNGTTALTDDLQLADNSTTPKRVQFNFQCPSDFSTNDLKIRIEATDNAAAAVKFDDFYLGLATNVGTVRQAKFLGSIKYAATTNCQWQRTGGGSNTIGNFAADTDCPTPTVSGSATAPGTKIPGLVIPYIPAGRIEIVATGGFHKSGANDASVSFRFSDGANSTSGTNLYVGTQQPIVPTINGSITYPSAQSNVTIQIQGSTENTSNTVNVIANAVERDLEIRVYHFPSSDQEVAALDSDGWRVDANISGANPSLGTSSVTTYTGIEDSGLTLTNNTGRNIVTARIPCSSTNSPTGTTCSVGNESVGISFSIPKAQDVRACVSFSTNQSTGASGNVLSTFQIVETASNAQTILQEGKSRLNGGPNTQNTNMSVPYRLCGEFYFQSAGQKTLRLFYEQAVVATVTSSVVLADANTSNGQRDIHWTVEPLNAPNPPFYLKTYGFSATTSTTAATTSTPFIFTNVLENVDGAYNVSNGRFAVPAPGRYHCSWTVYFNAGNTANLYLNSAVIANGGNVGSASSASSGSLQRSFNQGDVIEIRPDANVTATGGAVLNRFSCYRIGL